MFRGRTGALIEDGQTAHTMVQKVVTYRKYLVHGPENRGGLGTPGLFPIRPIVTNVTVGHTERICLGFPVRTNSEVLRMHQLFCNFF